MPKSEQYCDECYRACEVSLRPGERGNCPDCDTVLKVFSELRPAIKFACGWRKYGIEGITPVTEFRFDQPRSRRRLDFAFPDFQVGVEIDGYGPGHLNMASINTDHAKVNDAAVLGWCILRYTSQMIGSRDKLRDSVWQVAQVLDRILVDHTIRNQTLPRSTDPQDER